MMPIRKAYMPLLLATALLMSFAAHAAPRAPQADRARVELALSAYHRPPTARQLLQLGIDVDVVLREIVEEPRGNRLARNRALTTLRHFPGMETRALLERVLAETSGKTRGMAVLDLSKALPSYAAVVGPEAAQRLQGLLKHAVLEVRLAAAVALRLSRHANARALISSHLGQERSAIAQKELQRQLVILDRQPVTK